MCVCGCVCGCVGVCVCVGGGVVILIVSGPGRQARTTRSLIMSSVTSCHPADNSKNGKGSEVCGSACFCASLFIFYLFLLIKT